MCCLAFCFNHIEGGILSDPLRPQKERILDQIIATGLRRKDKEIEYLKADGEAKERARTELYAMHLEEDRLVAEFTALAGSSEKK